MKKGIVVAGILFLISGCGRAPEDKMTKEEDLFPETTIEVPESGQQATGVVSDPSAQTFSQTGSQPAPTSMSVPMSATPQAVKESILGTSSQGSTKDVQRALTALKLYEGRIDGKMGPKTKKAIEEFQRQNGLKVDGVAGPRTWQKLKSYLTASGTSAPTTNITTR